MTTYAADFLAKLPADYGKAAPVGLFVILALGIVVVFLVRSMNKHVKKVPPAFGAAGAAPAPNGEAASTGSDEQAKVNSDLAASAASPPDPTTTTGASVDESARDERASRGSIPTDPA